MYFAGITDHPAASGPPKPPGTCCSVTATNSPARALVRDRGSQFIDAFDEIFRTEGCKVLKTPVRTPVANAFAERWIGTLRRELLDRTIIWNRRQLNNLVVDYIDHYNMRVRIRVGSTGGDGSITTCPASWWWLRVVSASPPVPVRRCRLIEA